jgi:hypothetical protein
MKSFAAGLETLRPGENRRFRMPEGLLRALGFDLLQTLVEVFLSVLYL